MAEATVSPDEQALRRRARRRLVGVIALALLAVVVLPMVFDPEPKPMANDVDVRIPDQTAPFDKAPAPAPVSAPTAAPAPAPQPAPVLESEPAASAPGAVAKAEQPAAPAAKAEPKPVVQPKPVEKTQPKPKAEAVAKPSAPIVKAKPVEKPKVAEKPKPEAKPAAVHGGAYYLQLGSFSSDANARQMVAKAAAAGFKAVVVSVSGQYKVRVGPVEDRAKAVDQETALKAKGIGAVVVGP